MRRIIRKDPSPEFDERISIFFLKLAYFHYFLLMHNVRLQRRRPPASSGSRCSTLSACSVLLAFEHGPEHLELADVDRLVGDRQEHPVSYGQVKLRRRAGLVPRSVGKGLNDLRGLRSDVLDPLEHSLDGLNGRTDVIHGIPVWSEYRVLWWNKVRPDALNEFAYVRALTVRDMANVPQHAEVPLVRNPEQLLLRQPIDLMERVGVPEPPVHLDVTVQPVSKVVPF